MEIIQLGPVAARGYGRPDYTQDSIVVTDYVYYDSQSGYSGTQYPVGTTRFPVNNIADLVAICVSRNLYNIMLLSSITFDRDMENYNFAGSGGSAVNFNGFSVSSSTFRGLFILGTQGAMLTTGPSFYECYISTMVDFAPWIIKDCIIAGTLNMVGGLLIFNSAFYWAAIHADGQNVGVYGSTGFFSIGNHNAALEASSIEMVSGSVDVEVTCTLGTIEMRGDFVLTDNSAGTLLIDYRASTHIQAIEDAVYFDSVNGVAGTTYPIGTPQRPVNNEADLVAIIANRALKKVILLSNITFTLGPWVGISFWGQGIITSVYLNYRVFTGCSFNSCWVYGGITPPGPIDFNNCWVYFVGGDVQARISDCFISAELGSAWGGGVDEFSELYMQGSVFLGTCVLYCGGYVWIGGCSVSGALEIDNVNAIAKRCRIALGGGEIRIQASCTAGIISLHGDFALIDNSAGATVYDYRTCRNGDTRFFQEAVAATDVNGVTWKDLLNRSTIYSPVRICGFTVTVAGLWAGLAKIRIVDGAGTTKIFPFQDEYVEGADFVSGTQVVFNFPVEVSALKGYRFQFRSTNAADGVGKTMQLNNLDVQELS